MIELSGKNITLRTMTQKETRALWRKFEPENGKFVYSEELADDLYKKSVELEEWNPSAGIFTKTDEIIGELTFQRIVFSEKRCDLSIFLANESYRGKGYGTEAIMLAKKYAKESLGLKKMHADVSSNNIRMQKALKKCGFLHTKTFKGDAPDGGDRMSFVIVL